MRFFRDITVKKQSSEKGFTLIEMLIVAPIVILTIGAFLTVIISMTGEVLASRAANNLSYNVQDALNRIEQDTKLSSGFLATNTVLGTAQGYNDDATNFTNVGGTSGTSLILNMVATTSNPISSSSSYVFLKNKPNDCSNAQQNTPFTYNVVYYVRNSTLYRRTIMPANYNDTTNTVCSTPYQQPSCSPAYMDAQSASVFCKTKDIQLVSGVSASTFFVQYFNNEASTSENKTASDTSAATTDRNVALQSATTIGVSIDATQTAGGRDVERSAVMRVSRLDNNASAIGTITTDSNAPAAPTVTASVAEPTNVVFSWGSVPSATGYTLQYQINSGSWVTAFTNQNTRTYTVTGATHNNVVNARVTATNAFGTSGQGTASATVPLWVSPNLQNLWSNFNSGYANAGYTKTADGYVIVKGLITRSGTPGNPETLFTLPAGYRPEKLETFQVESGNDGASVTVNTDGTVVASTNISGSWVSLSDIKFLSSTSPHVWQNLTLSNGWTNRAASSDDPALAYTSDAIGRIHIRGSIASGTVTDNTAIATLPATTASSPAVTTATAKYSHIAVRSGSGGSNLTGVGNTASYPRQLLAKGVAVGTAYFLNYSFLPDSYPAANWTTVTPTSPWVNYGGIYNTLQYTKSSDNIVTIRGLIKTGTSGTVFTLPANSGLRPVGRLITAAVCNSAVCRVDVDGNTGVVTVVNGGSATWTSLDRVSYYADGN